MLISVFSDGRRRWLLGKGRLTHQRGHDPQVEDHWVE